MAQSYIPAEPQAVPQPTAPLQTVNTAVQQINNNEGNHAATPALTPEPQFQPQQPQFWSQQPQYQPQQAQQVSPSPTPSQ